MAATNDAMAISKGSAYTSASYELSQVSEARVSADMPAEADWLFRCHETDRHLGCNTAPG